MGASSDAAYDRTDDDSSLSEEPLGSPVPSPTRGTSRKTRERAVARAKRGRHAKDTINKTIPAILKSNPRARRGIEAVERLTDPPPFHSHCVATSNVADRCKDTRASTTTGSTNSPRISLKLQVSDTLEAAYALAKNRADTSRPPRVAVLNMASPLRPGGGVLSGATSQEEWLCARTTLYPSLRDEFYRLPDIGGVYTPDVMVFRIWDGEAGELDKRERFYVDVVSAAMLRFPDVNGEGDDKTYAEPKDRDMVLSKMRAVMRILRSKGVERVVLGAWGCGAYGNPVREIAQAWRRVLIGSRTKKSVEIWDGLEVVFAIKGAKMATDFSRHFGPELLYDGPSRDVQHDDSSSSTVSG